MINLVVEYLEGFDPLLNAFNTYSVYLYSLLFAGLFAYTKNYLALVIAGESILGYIVNNYLDIHILTITGQFIIYGFAFYLCRKNSLISLSYLILLSHFLIQYISNSILISTNTLTAYNIALLVYYLFYAILPIVIFLMIKGLFSRGGGIKNGYGNSTNNVVYADDNAFYSGLRRFKRSNNRGHKRAF